jgi:hypothetical protein
MLRGQHLLGVADISQHILLVSQQQTFLCVICAGERRKGRELRVL